MTIKHRALAAVVGMIVTAVQLTPVFAGQEAAKPETVFEESFDSYVTNTDEIKSLTITGGTGKVVQLTPNNKMLKLPKGQQVSVQKVTPTKPDNEFTISMRINPGTDKVINGTIGILSTNRKYAAINIQNGTMKLSDGKEVDGIVAGQNNDIELRFRTMAKRLDVTVNGKKRISQWKLGTWPSSPDGFYIDKLSNEEWYIDNIVVQNGLDDVAAITRSFNNESMEDLHIEENNSDYTYFNSNYITTGGAGKQGFFNYNENQKTGKITREMADYKNPNKGNCIIVEKLTGDDVYFESNIRKIKIYNDSAKYSYFYLSTDLWCSNNKMVGQMFLLRDSTSGTSNADAVLALYSGTDLILCNGQTVKNVIKPKTWMNYKALVNLETHMAKIYVNDELVADNVKFNQNLKNLDLVRFTAERNSAVGMVKVKNVEVTGLVKEPKDLDFEHTYIFPDDEAIKEYLSDKISFHKYSGICYKDGERNKLENGILYENNEMYVPLTDFNSIFGTEYKLQGGELTAQDSKIELSGGIRENGDVSYVPLKELVQKQLGKYVTDDGYGMVLVANQKMHWKPEEDVPQHKKPWNDGVMTTLSPLQNLNSFLMFDRPSPEELQSKFEAEMSQRAEQHPRLFGTREDFDKIKEMAETDEYLKDMIDRLAASADSYLTREIPSYSFSDNYRTYNTANSFNTRVQNLGFMYLITGDKKYSDRVWQEMEAVASFPDFNVSHSIDAGLYIGGLAFGYDWCYDALTEEQRSIIEKAVMEKGINVLGRAFYRGAPSSASAATAQTSTQVTNYFTKWMSNYNSHVNVGIIMGALAFAELDPQYCFRVLNQSMRSVEYAMYGFAPGGSWVESNVYWVVTVDAIVKIIASLEGIYGTDFGYGKCQGFEETGYFHASFGTGNGTIAFGDDTGDSGSITSPVYSFFGKRFGQSDLAALRKKHVTGGFRRLSASGVGVFDLLYYTPVDVNEVKNLPKMQAFHGLESIAFHEDYDDPEAFFLTAYAGLSYTYHGHNDGGAFGFDMLGERWATDLGREDYNVGLANTGIYRKRTEGHNTITINNGAGYGQRADGFAGLTKYDVCDAGGYAVYDMSDYYTDAKTALRGFYIDDNFTALTVRDELDLTKNSEVYWFMHTKANIDIIDEKTAFLYQGGKSITLQLETDAAEFELSEMAAAPLPTSPQGGNQNPNAGYRKVAIRLNGSGKVNLTVRMSPYMVETVKTTPISEWTLPQSGAVTKDNFGYKLIVNGREMSNPSVIPVLDENNIPEYKIIPDDPTKIVEIVNDPKAAGEKVELMMYNADRSKKMRVRITYSTGSEELLEFFESHLAKSIKVTDEPESANPGNNAIDNDIISRWCAKAPDAHGILDFGEVVEFDSFTAGFWKGNERKYTFELYASEDGELYVPIKSGTFTSSGTTDSYEIYRLGKTYKARYIKFVNKGNTATTSPNNEFSNLTELLLLKYLQ